MKIIKQSTNSILLNNSRIKSISELEENTSNIDRLVLTNNFIQDLHGIEKVSDVKFIDL
jgi:hypothetical protein